MTAKEYWVLLKKHDWFYFNSHSRSYYESEDKKNEELISLYKKHPELKKHYFRKKKLTFK